MAMPMGLDVLSAGCGVFNYLGGECYSIADLSRAMNPDRLIDAGPLDNVAVLHSFRVSYAAFMYCFHR